MLKEKGSKIMKMKGIYILLTKQMKEELGKKCENNEGRIQFQCD